MEQFDRVWFGCCPSGRIPSGDYGIPTRNSNDITRSAVGLSQAANCWKQMRTHAPKPRECLFLKSPEHRYVHEVLDLYPHSTRVRWFGHFCLTEIRFVDVLTWGFMMRWPCQNRPLTKKNRHTLIRACQNRSRDLCTYHQTRLWIHDRVAVWVPWCNGLYHGLCFKC